MEIQHLEKVDDFLPGRKYSLLGSKYGDLLNITVNNLEYNYVVKATLENGDPQNYSFKEEDFPMNVVLHDKEEFFILVRSSFLIGTFATEAEADAFLAENTELIEQLDGVDDTIEVVDRDHLDDIAKEFFWLQYEKWVGGEKKEFKEGVQFSPQWIEKTDNLTDYINQEA